jgi:transposase-like protein
MPRIRYTTEQIINKLRQAEVLVAQGHSVGEVAKELGVSEHTYYRWRKEYGGVRSDQAKRLKLLEKENERLKKLVADLSLDNAILKDAAEGNW